MAMFKRAHVPTVMECAGDHRDTALAIARRAGDRRRTGASASAGRSWTGRTNAALKERGGRNGGGLFPGLPGPIRLRIVRALKGWKHRGHDRRDAVDRRALLKGSRWGGDRHGGRPANRCGKAGGRHPVLTDGRFRHHREGRSRRERGVYENIKKAVIFLLSSNFGEIMTMFTRHCPFLFRRLSKGSAIFCGSTLITDSLPALALGTDKNDGPALMESRAHGQAMRACFPGEGWRARCFMDSSIAAHQPYGSFLRLPVGILAAEGRRITVESLSLVLGDPAVLARCQTNAGFTVLGLSQLFHAVGMRGVGRSVFRMGSIWKTG